MEQEKRLTKMSDVMVEVNKHIKHDPPRPWSPGVCVWTIEDDYYGEQWNSACGETWWFENGTPIHNKMKFCPFCGRELTEKEIV